MDWHIILLFSLYAGVGVISLGFWWLVYGVFLSRGHNLREAVFGQRPNPAVALDLAGGFLAVALLLFSLINSAPRTSFRLNIPAVLISLLFTVALLAILRALVAGGLRAWFRDRIDAQGDLISLNNELFIQRNMATGLFSTVLYLILVAGLVELDPWHPTGQGFSWLYNMLGIWLAGVVIIALHSFLYLGYGTRNHILHECFHDNNPSAPLSLLGLVAPMLPLVHQQIIAAGPGAHLFNNWGIWGNLGMILLVVLVIRGMLQIILFLATRINLRYELVVHDNLAWGIIDGGLIFSLVLILNALLA